MAIYNFNEVSGGSTPVEVEVNQIKIGDIILTNRQNVEAYNLEGVELLQLIEYSQIVDASLYPKLALIPDYQYGGAVINTQFISDTTINSLDTANNFVLRDEENTFLLFPQTTNSLRKLNADNTVTVLNASSPNFVAGFSLFINFDNFTKVLCLYKESNIIKSVFYDKISNTFSVASNIMTVDATTGKVFAARLMQDGLIYIGLLTTTGNATIFRTSDGIVFENYFTTTLNHWNTSNSNYSCCDEYGTMNFDENYNLYFLEQSGTNRSLGFFDLVNKQKLPNLYTFTTSSGLSSFFGVNIKNNQILLYQSQSSNILNLIIFDKSDYMNYSYSIALNDSSLVGSIFILDYNHIFVRKNSGRDLVYINQFTTQYNYTSLSGLYNNFDTLDFRYNNIAFIYKYTATSTSTKRLISLDQEFETLVVPRQIIGSYQSSSYLVTDIIEGI